MSAKPTGDGPGVEESDKNLDGATGGGRACNRDRYRREDRVRVGQRVDEHGRDPSANPSYMYGSNEEAILDPYRLSLHLIAGFGEGITLQHAVDRLFDHLSTGFRPICVAESHRHQHHHRRPRRTRKPRTGYPPLHVQVFLMPKELGMSCRLLSRPPWRLRHWHLPPGAPQRGIRIYTLSDLPAPLWSVVEAQGGHPMLRFVVNASHDTFSAACRLYTKLLLLGGESRDLGLLGNEEAIRSIAALNNIAELNESMVDEKIAGNYSQEYTRRFTGLNAESKKKSNILDRQHDGQRNNRHGGSNSSTLMNDHVKACGQLNGVGKADGDGSDRRLAGDEGCRKSCGLSPSRDRTSQPSQDGSEWSTFASGFEGELEFPITFIIDLIHPVKITE
uniref:FAM124 domain-containing protein n=1 Tax=Eptatretus burgeri TaxID=7764 RepID=A0A8C4N5F3_EPTBU